MIAVDSATSGGVTISGAKASRYPLVFDPLLITRAYPRYSSKAVAIARERKSRGLDLGYFVRSLSAGRDPSNEERN